MIERRVPSKFKINQRFIRYFCGARYADQEEFKFHFIVAIEKLE